jgi:hypothetical protein
MNTILYLTALLWPLNGRSIIVFPWIPLIAIIINGVSFLLVVNRDPNSSSFAYIIIIAICRFIGILLHNAYFSLIVLTFSLGGLAYSLPIIQRLGIEILQELLFLIGLRFVVSERHGRGHWLMVLLLTVLQFTSLFAATVLK